MNKLKLIFPFVSFIVWLVFIVTTVLLNPQMTFNAPAFLQVAWFICVAYIYVHGVWLTLHPVVEIVKAARKKPDEEEIRE